MKLIKVKKETVTEGEVRVVIRKEADIKEMKANQRKIVILIKVTSIVRVAILVKGKIQRQVCYLKRNNLKIH